MAYDSRAITSIHQRLIREQIDLQREISATPTGPQRNQICDASIHLTGCITALALAQSWGTHLSLKTIEQIKAHVFVGNHAFDSRAFKEIENFVRDENHSTADRASALRHMVMAGMGESVDPDAGKTDDELVAAYMKFVDEINSD